MRVYHRQWFNTAAQNDALYVCEGAVGECGKACSIELCHRALKSKAMINRDFLD